LHPERFAENGRPADAEQNVSPCPVGKPAIRRSARPENPKEVYMISAYPACFIKDESGYYVVFPDLRYLATCAPSLEEGLSAAIDCLAGYLYSCRQSGESVPEPSPMQNLQPEAIAGEMELQPAEAFINMIAVDVEEYARVHFEKSVKKTLTIPVWMNKAALKRGLNFSQVLQEALTERLRS